MDTKLYPGNICEARSTNRPFEMTDTSANPCTAFQDDRRLASGPLSEMALVVKAAMADADAEARPVLVFDDTSGRVIDIDTRGTDAAILARLRPEGAAEIQLPSRGRGRPRLGVVAREVTLLPRHWDWLATQSGGASSTRRRTAAEAPPTRCGRLTGLGTKNR